VALSALDNPTSPPTPEELDATLGPAAHAWAELIADVRHHAGELNETWAFSSAKFGWSLRLVQQKRVLVYLTPQAGRLLVGVVLGEKAIAKATAAGLASARTVVVMDAAPRYAEGRGIRLPVETDEDLALAMELARIKIGR
jgi:hypothetical protein